MDDAIWAAEKAVSNARSDWNEVVLLMKDIGLKPQLKTFSSWLWASATVSEVKLICCVFFFFYLIQALLIS